MFVEVIAINGDQLDFIVKGLASILLLFWQPFFYLIYFIILSQINTKMFI